MKGKYGSSNNKCENIYIKKKTSEVCLFFKRAKYRTCHINDGELSRWGSAAVVRIQMVGCRHEGTVLGRF